MRWLLPLLAVTALAIAATAAQGADPKTYTVKVGDDFFSPTKKTIKRKDVVKWVWVGENGKAGETVNEHTIFDTAEEPYFKPSKTKLSGTFKVRFKRTGRFKIACAEHEEMKLTVKVKE